MEFNFSYLKAEIAFHTLGIVEFLDNFHTIVIGGGPAGLQCARTLSKLGYKTLLLEKSATPGDPNFSTAGVPLEVFSKYSLPKDPVADTIYKIGSVTPNQTNMWTSSKPIGYVLDFRKFKVALVKEIETRGGVVSHNSTATDVETKEDRVVKVHYVKDEKEQVASADYFIDASSFSAVIANRIGLTCQNDKIITNGMEKIIQAKLPDFFKGSIVVYFGNKFVPHGYTWVFCFGEDTYKVGVIFYEHSHYKASKSLGEYLEEFIKYLGITEYTELEEHGGSLIMNGGFGKNTKENVIAVGDTLSTINPLFAEGIRHALFSGELAAQSIHKKESGQIKDLSDYDSKLKAYRKYKWLQSRLLANLIYHWSSDSLKDYVNKKLSSLTIEDVLDVGFNYQFKKAVMTTLFSRH